MDLFLETPQQQAERMLRQQQRLMEMQMQGVAAQAPLRKTLRPLLYLQPCPGANRRQRPIPYNKIHMRRSLRSTNAARVTAAWASACAHWR